MSVKMLVLLVRACLVAALSAGLSAGPPRPRREVPLSGRRELPLSAAQRRSLQDAVCEADLGLAGDELSDCKDNFKWDVEPRGEARAPCCRSNSSLAVRLPAPADHQPRLLLLLPLHAHHAHALEYQILMPPEKYGQLPARPEVAYGMYWAALGASGAAAGWHLLGRAPRWAPPAPRPYRLQLRVAPAQGRASASVAWNRTGDLDACFNLVVKCSKMTIFESRTLWPDAAREQVFQLPANDSCSLLLSGLHGATSHRFTTHTASDTDVPEEPSLEPLEFKLYSEEEGARWRVVAWWARPRLQPDWYNVTLRADRATSLLLPGNATEAEFRQVSGAGLYNVTVEARRGRQLARYTKLAPFTRAGAGAAWGGVWRWAGAAVAAWLATVAAAALYWRLRACPPSIAVSAKHKQVPAESKPAEGAAEAARAEVAAPDAWEIKAECLQLHELIGEGAFGLVRRGTLAPLGKEVAVKMLKDFPSAEEMRAFRVEMELMKSVGAHPHVVSLVGCCAARRARPALVAEYCSRGDLLNFLRRSWDVMVSKRHASYYNNNAEYRHQLQAGAEQARLVVNRLYEAQGCEPELTPQDLLSFCRQVAMGMEFLALNKVVHRDLAARNVLVTHDRTLKIADFGLSRDVYEENHYRQKGNGKMPVKWMALESLTRRIYTTQSDVWSFGVVMWEVVTVGGAPYAGVAATRLPRLLRQGYRMPRPPNCTHHLYSLMESCWAARPRERPTFAELHTRLDELLRGAAADQYLSLELDDEPPPTPKPTRYFRMIVKARHWGRAESYERPLAAPRNHYSAPPHAASPA